VEHGKVVSGLLVPSDQDAAEAVEPGMGSLHDPAACRFASLALTRDLLAAGAQMQGEPEGLS